MVFEPRPANIVALERFIELNSTYDITLMRMALGEASGETESLVMTKTSMAKVSASPFQAGESWVDRFLVPAFSDDGMRLN